MNGAAPHTPSRDRSPANRFDQSHSASPTVSRSALSLYPATPGSATTNGAVATVDSLSAQNTQLWKLIEKQRTGYSQIMKELERVRSERDVYRSRLHSLGENTDALLKAHKEKERREGKDTTLRSAASHTHLRANENAAPSGSHVPDPKGPMVRTSSDDVASRQSQRHLAPSHSQEPLSQIRSPSKGRDRQDSQGSLNIAHSSSQLSTAYLSVSQTSSSSQLSVSGSSTSASTNNLSIRIPDRQNDPRHPSPLHLTPARSGSLPTSFSAHYDIPSAYLPDAKSSAMPPPPNINVVSSDMGTSELKQGSAASSIPQPRTSSPTDPVRPHLSPQVLVPSATESQPTSSYDLSLPSRPSALSRESRISLPEEAKRYYATIGDSPVASPRFGTGFPSSTRSSSPEKQSSGLTAIPEPTGPAQQATSVNGTGQPGKSLTNGRALAGTEDSGEFLDMEDGDSAYDSVEGSGRVSEADGAEPEDHDDEGSEEGQRAGARNARNSTKGAAVEDFPLPPSTPPIHIGGEGYTQAQMQALAAQRTHTDASSIDSRSLSSEAYQSNVASESRIQLLQTSSSSQQQPPPSPGSPFPLPQNAPHATFRALPLLATDLPRTQIQVSHSSIRPNDRGKDVLSFEISVDPGTGKEPWKVEKLYSDVITLDARVRGNIGKTMGKKLAALPEGRLWKDHAPAKVDQRKTALELYLRSLIALPVKNKDEVVAFFTSDIIREAHKPVLQAGYKEGYLTKRGKNFGGWKTRFFVLQGPSLEYYESRGGTHLGSITITGAQIGRQQKAADKRETDEDNEYRHAFLIIEAKRGPGGSNPRHVLCAESDEERDSWVEELVRYVTGSYNEDELAVIQNSAAAQIIAGRASISSDVPSTPTRRTREIAKGPALPISQLTPDSSNAKLFPAASGDDASSISSPAKSTSPPSFIDNASAAMDLPISSSLPVTSPLMGADDSDSLSPVGQRANSELGHYPDLVDQRTVSTVKGRLSPEQHRRKAENRRSVNPLKPATIPEVVPSPDKEASPITPRVDAHGKVKISGPMNGTPIPAGYKFGKDAPPAEPSASNDSRRERAKSRMFWGFGRQHEKPTVPAMAPRAVFGVSLEESLDVAEIASLPAIVFRCIQYLEAKQAEQEEGIYRLSGSSAVIKALKDRFNLEGDVDLLSSDEYWDPHAIAGLLKTFLRELPASILTRDLHLRFLAVIDFVDPQERIQELSHLIASLPTANYSLLRALTAHLILIVQNAHINKMTMRNVGIVFSPTLGIPAGVFSLMLGEFKRVFNVDGTEEGTEEVAVDGDGQPADLSRRNSKHYSDAAADKMLGLAGRTLTAPDDAASDEGEGDETSMQEESGTENESIHESSTTSSSAYHSQLQYAERPQASEANTSPTSTRSRASHVAMTRGLNIATDKASRRQSRMVGGLPTSPRPTIPPSPMSGSTPQANQQSTPNQHSSPHSPRVPVSPQVTPK